MEDLEEEIWKDVVGYEGTYEVSSFGRVKSLARTVFVNKHYQPIRERILAINMNTGKYSVVELSMFGKHKTTLVHRLVAAAFIPNPNNLATINHIDGNKQNNRVGNLEWMTQLDNVRHAISIGIGTSGCTGRFNEKHHRSKVVYQYDLNGVFIKQFPSLSEVGRQLNVTICAVSMCIRNPKRLKQVRGYRWSYERFDVFPPYVS